MNVNSFLSPRMLAGAAVVGLIGAAGVFIYEQVYAEKRRAMLVNEVQRLDKQMCSMRKEMEALRDLQRESLVKRQKARRPRREVKQKAPGAPAAVTGSGDVVDGGAGEGEQSYVSDSEYFTDYQSVLSTDGEMDSEEFYDVHTDDDSDDTLRGSNGHVPAGELDEDLSEKCAEPPKSSPTARHAT